MKTLYFFIRFDPNYEVKDTIVFHYYMKGLEYKSAFLSGGWISFNHELNTWSDLRYCDSTKDEFVTKAHEAYKKGYENVYAVLGKVRCWK